MKTVADTPPVTNSQAIVIDDVSREFPDGTGLHTTSLTVKPGEFISILGPSGCGKSTLLRCIAGLETPDTGRISLAGRDVFDAAAGINLPPNKRGLGMVFQDLALWPHMTIDDNIAFPLSNSPQKITADQRRERVRQVMEMVGIASKSGTRPAQLSGGQQQRVAIARAIVGHPSLLLMDEPLSALDAALREQIRAEIRALVSALGLTVVYVTHDQSEALAMSDRVVVMKQGTIRQDAPPVEIYEHPADRFVAGFVGTMNRTPDGRGLRPERLKVTTGHPPHNAVATGEVTDCQYTGGRWELRMSIDGANEPWLVYSHTPHMPGTRLAVTDT